MKITIKEKELELKYSFRSMMIYEKITGASFQLSGFTEIMVYFYSTILASDKDISLTFDEFVDWVDENKNLLNDFTTWINGIMTRNSVFSEGNSEPTEDIKKN